VQCAGLSYCRSITVQTSLTAFLSVQESLTAGPSVQESLTAGPSVLASLIPGPSVLASLILGPSVQTSLTAVQGCSGIAFTAAHSVSEGIFYSWSICQGLYVSVCLSIQASLVILYLSMNLSICPEESKR
jgi:hypothetical protein